ncbi:hypothetical protein [Aliiroseovarius lamellibrachiae]|uniref:hypothetical protein n=1 Tax=Aliiroseovarius lamellibrachiae TaxID=1924933 RepID=UPI001BE0FCA9|nr:hypothetical protein [Aliiroseovarius lamellibrachiae]MBT2130351.1 hypothetical protein [Aliiroseovarius lamellibrachiae]
MDTTPNSFEISSFTVTAIGHIARTSSPQQGSALLMTLLLRRLPLRGSGLPKIENKGLQENNCFLYSLRSILAHISNLRTPSNKVWGAASLSSSRAYELAGPFNIDFISEFDGLLRSADQIIANGIDEEGLLYFAHRHLAPLKQELVNDECLIIEGFSEPLDAYPIPSWAIAENNEFISLWGHEWMSASHWSFWRDWYQGFLDGKPLDWDLQRRVALIPDDDWEKGPEHIAQKIEEIRARFELEKRIAELEAEKHVWEERARLGIGGNNPPEALEDDIRIVQEIIWAPIEDLKAETQSETPDNSRIKSAISKLGAALIAIGKWPLGKLDKAADEFAKSLGKWGGGACAGWLALNSDKIAEIIKAAQDWLGTLF